MIDSPRTGLPLTPDQRIAVSEAIQAGLNNSEIERHTGVNRKTVRKIRKNAMGKAKDALRKVNVQPCDAARVLYFTDCHDRVDLNKDRFYWLGRYAKNIKPDLIICGGDMMDVDSLNSHDKNETYNGKLKPSFARELESFNMALKAINEHAAHIPRHVTLGNHEDRIQRWENENPETIGILRDAFMGLLKGYGWTHTEYKRYFNYMGVDFSHVPLKGGHPVSGELTSSKIARKSIKDIVYGHTHRFDSFIDSKFGDDNIGIRAVNGGCFLPDGWKFPYARGSSDVINYGCVLLTIQHGRLEGVEWKGMRLLEAEYGQKITIQTTAGPKV